MNPKHTVAGLVRNAIRYVSGDGLGYPLEHRVYNVLAFSIIIFSFQVGLMNYYVGLHWMISIAGFSGCVVAGVLFYLSRYKGAFNGFTIYTIMIAGIVILAVIYPYDGGSQGAWILGTLTLIIVFITISPNKSQLLVLAVWLLFVLTLFTIEYVLEDWVLTYASKRQRLLDMMVTFTYCLSVMGLTIITFKRSYHREREKVQQQNEELSRKNRQIEILMKELNHRVKNNLQVVSTLLNLQSAQIEDPVARNAVLDGRNRLLSMVLIHQKLYQNEKPTEINMRDYLIELCNNIVATNRSVHYGNYLLIDVDDIALRIEHAVPLGLIVNELVTNTVKHAFVMEQADDRVQIRFAGVDREFLLAVSDNGKRFTGPLRESFGLQLVRSLVDQLEGRMEMLPREPGTEIRINFSIAYE